MSKTYCEGCGKIYEGEEPYLCPSCYIRFQAPKDEVDLFWAENPDALPPIIIMDQDGNQDIVGYG